MSKVLLLLLLLMTAIRSNESLVNDDLVFLEVSIKNQIMKYLFFSSPEIVEWHAKQFQNNVYFKFRIRQTN